jgi:beta-glucosidase
MMLAAALTAFTVGQVAAGAVEQFAAGAGDVRPGAKAPLPTDQALLGAKYLNPKASIEERVNDLFARLTPGEKAALVHGCSGMGYGDIPRIGLPEILMTDGPQGVRMGQGTATAFPGSLALAATWNPALVEQGGMVFGRECQATSQRVFLAPGVNIMRTPLGGRNFEYMGEDPYLAGKTAAAYIRGVQSQRVAACVKHWNFNEQEHWRTTINVECDDRALHEIYGPAFEMAVKEGKVWSAMPAYNRFRGDYCAASKFLNSDVLVKEYGFDGATISDWGAWHDDQLCLNGGCTIEMPSGKDAKRDARIAERVAKGEISQVLFDEAVRRNLRLLFRVGAFEAPKAGAINTSENQKIARQAATEGIVLLKNAQNILPLDAAKIKKLAVIGPNANQYQTMADGSDLATRGGSGAMRPPYEITPLEALQQRFGDKVIYAPGLQFEKQRMQSAPLMKFPEGLKAEFFANNNCQNEPVATRIDKEINFRFTIDKAPVPRLNPQRFSVRWTGLFTAPKGGSYELVLSSDDGSRLWIDDQLVIDHWGDHDTQVKTATIALDPSKPAKIKLEYQNNGGKGDLALKCQRLSVPANISAEDEAITAAKQADVVLFFAGTDHSYDREALGWGDVKGADKPDLELKGPQAELIKKIAAVNPKTIVILINGAPVSVEQWQAQVPAIVEAWYGGQEAGNAIADILLGNANPSGKLPCTFGKKLDDWLCHQLGPESYPGTGNNGLVKYSDSIWVGYRHFDNAKIEPRYPFGHGLSFTTFKYGRLTQGVLQNDNPKEVTIVSIPVTNTGKRPGAEVVQLYIADLKSSVPRPPQELKGFQKLFLKPGETKIATFTITRRDLSFWDVTTHAWKAEPGDFELRVGSSSRDIRAKAEFKLQ